MGQRPIQERLKEGLRQAMKERQQTTVRTIRTMLSAIDNAGAVEVDTSYVPYSGITKDVPRRELSEAEMLELLRTEAAERRQAMLTYARLGQADVAARLRAELDVFEYYLADARDDI